jgi:hypothetical protein
MINLFADRTFVDFQEADDEGWTTMQRVAAFGTRQDLEQMLKLYTKAQFPLRQRYMPPGWELISYAVLAGNPETFSVLLPVYGDQAQDVIDNNGWSLLHHSVTRACVTEACGRVYAPNAITKGLLEAGINPYQLTGLPDPKSAEDIAYKTSRTMHRAYLATLRELDISRQRPDLDWSDGLAELSGATP